MSNLLPWVDIETFGLDEHDPIIEVGIILTDLDLNQIAWQSWVCWEPGYEDAWKYAPEIVKNMHGGEAGLIHVAKNAGISRKAVEAQIIDWLARKDATNLPICGNSIGTDKMWLKAQMPHLLNTFHYRVIDVSTLKETARRYNLPVFESAPVKGLAHRAIGDLQESIAEFKHYRDNFLRVA